MRSSWLVCLLIRGITGHVIRKELALFLEVGLRLFEGRLDDAAAQALADELL